MLTLPFYRFESIRDRNPSKGEGFLYYECAHGERPPQWIHQRWVAPFFRGGETAYIN